VEADVERLREAGAPVLLPSFLPPPSRLCCHRISARPPMHRPPSPGHFTTPAGCRRTSPSRTPPRQSQPHAATHARSFSRVPKPRPVKPGSGPTGPSWRPPDRERHCTTNLLRLTFPSAASSSSAVGHAGTSAGHHRARGHRVHRCSPGPPSEPGATAKAVK
jgi:hypothetical protein